MTDENKVIETNTSLDLAKNIAEYALSKKAEDVLIIDMKEISGFTDYFVICSGTSNPHVKAIADEVDDKLIEQGVKYWHREGYEQKQWVLLDYVDVVVHVFDKDQRSFYDLEKLWGDAEQLVISDE